MQQDFLGVLQVMGVLNTEWWWVLMQAQMQAQVQEKRTCVQEQKMVQG